MADPGSVGSGIGKLPKTIRDPRLPVQYYPGQGGGPIPVGPNAFAPGYVPFPGAHFGTFDPIAGANYKPIDAGKFQRSYGPKVRNEMRRNARFGNQLALSQLDTELQGLKKFAPEATALRIQENSKLEQSFRDETQKRSQLRRDEIQRNEQLRQQQIRENATTQRELVGVDNAFNQQQRTEALDRALPQVRGQLSEQAARAEAYASGRAPDSIIDRGLEIAGRSAAADAAIGGGFGGRSGAARNLSDIMSATQRIGLSQYGDQLLSSNINQRAGLELAPTEYTNAASQVRVEPGWSTDAGFNVGAGFSTESGISSAPSVSIAALAAQNFGNANAATVIPAGTAYQGTIQQAQFGAGLQQRTQEFNATGTSQMSLANAQIGNQFALQGHQYEVGYQGALAGAAQTNRNAEIAYEQQAQAQAAYQSGQDAATTAGNWGAAANLISTGVTAYASGGLDSLFKSGGIAPSGGGAVGGIPTSAGGGGVTTQGGPSGVYVPGAAKTYTSGASYGGGSGSIVVPTSEGGIPSGYSGVTSGGGGTVSIPTGNGMSQSAGSQGVSQGGTVNFKSGAAGSTSGSARVDATADGIRAQIESSSEGTLPGKDALEIADTLQRAPDPGVTTFKEDTGVPVDTTSGSADVVNMNQASDSVLRMAGIYPAQVNGTQPIGSDPQGKQMYASTALLQSPNRDTGARIVQDLKKAILPFNVLTKKDGGAIDKISSVAGDPDFINNLSSQQQNGDKRGFINSILDKFEQPTLDTLKSDTKKQTGKPALDAAYSAHQLYNSWDKLSPAQQSLGLAGIGLKTYKYSSGEDLASKFVIPPKGPKSPFLTVGGALSLASSGYNVYGLHKNWDQMDNIQKVAGATTDMKQIAALGKGMNFLGEGTGGAAVPGVTPNALASNGWNSATEYGVGAVSSKAGTLVPAGYRGIANTRDGRIIAAPMANAATSDGATALGAGSVLNGVAGAKAVNATQVYKNWGTSSTKGVKNGALGGSALVGGLYGLAGQNPMMFAGVMATSILGEAYKDDAQADTAIFKKAGVTDDKGELTLADGTKANITRKEKLANTKAWINDYTHDLDYAIGMGGTTLARLLAGKKSSAADKAGQMLANANLTNIGFKQEFSQENYSRGMDNLRSQFAKAGIKSKADGYQLVNQGYAEHRWNDTDLVAMQQSLNMVFDTGPGSYGMAQKLIGGRENGIKAVTEQEETYTGKPTSYKHHTDSTDPILGVEHDNAMNPTVRELPTYNDAPEMIEAPMMTRTPRNRQYKAPVTLDKSQVIVRNRNKYKAGSTQPQPTGY